MSSSIAAERIDRLESLAAAAVRADRWDLARSYIRLARRIAERNRIALSQHFKRHTCDQCDLYLLPGRTARVRLQAGHRVITCQACGAQHRIPYK